MTTNDKVARLIPKGMLGTVATAVDDLVENLDDIAEIYVAVKYKDGTSDTYISGALLLLQERALEAL